MLRRLKLFIVQLLVLASLALAGLGAQAGYVMDMGSMHMQAHEHVANSESNIGQACDGMLADGMLAIDSIDCVIDATGCNSACSNCPAVNDHEHILYAATDSFGANAPVPATVAAQYPIDHPPKR